MKYQERKIAEINQQRFQIKEQKQTIEKISDSIKYLFTVCILIFSFGITLSIHLLPKDKLDWSPSFIILTVFLTIYIIKLLGSIGWYIYFHEKNNYNFLFIVFNNVKTLERNMKIENIILENKIIQNEFKKIFEDIYQQYNRIYKTTFSITFIIVGMILGLWLHIVFDNGLTEGIILGSFVGVVLVPEFINIYNLFKGIIISKKEC